MTSTGPRRTGAGGSGARARQATLQPRAQATRQAILTAAAERFARYGYYATSLDSVLADSGGTKGALYFHFASKEALARAVISVMMQRWGELRVQVGRRGLDPLSTLLALADEAVIRLIENPIARGGMRLLNDLPLHAQAAREHYGLSERDTRELLEQAAHAGLLRDGLEPAPLARQIVAMIAGHRQISEALGDRDSLRQRVDEAWALLLPAIASPTWLTTWSPHPPDSGPGDTPG
ncbi:MAG TPA: ScbR family autoregulator-binding transcription factor [Pseudonocardiaceae bacterium]